MTGQALVPTLVAKQEGILDTAVYNAASGDLEAEMASASERAA